MAAAAMFAVGFVGSSFIQPILGAAIDPLVYKVSKASWGRFRGKLAREDILVQSYYMGYISYDELEKYMGQLGYDNEQISAYIGAYRRLLETQQALTAWARGLMGDDELTGYLKRVGYDEKDIPRLKGIAKTIPGVTDLIEMAVKEAFNPEAAKTLQLDDEFDTIWQQLEPWAKKVFLDQDTAKLFWRAHWRLPSPEEVITMYNMFYPLIMYTKLPDGSYYGEKYNKYIGDFKKIITDDELVDKYLKWEDISPIWRDRFKAMTYPPITRVDLRRIYALGLISDQELLARIMQLGYSFEDAKLLMQFYKQYKMSEQRNLTKGEVERAYIDGLINQDQVKQYMQQLQYEDDEIEFYLKLWDYMRKNKQLETQLKALEKEYLEGYKTIQEVSDELNHLGLPGETIQQILGDFQAKKRASIKLPSKADIEHWFKLGLIKQSTAVNLLELLGYPESIAAMYLQVAKKVKSGKVELPSKTDIEHFVKHELITIDEAKSLLKQHGYSDDVVELYIKLWSTS